MSLTTFRRFWLHRSGLLLIFLIAYSVRIYGAWSSIAYIPDTQIIREALGIGQILSGRAAFDLSMAGPKYPLSLPYFLLVCYGSLFIGGRLTGFFPSVNGFVDFLFAQREVVHLFSVAALGLITASAALLTYKLARSLNSCHSGLIATGLATFDLLLTHLSHQARPHAPLASLSLLAVMLLLKMLKVQGWRWSIAATVASALVVGTLQSGAVILIPFGLAWGIRLWQARKAGSLKADLLKLIVSAVLLVALIMVVYPAIFSEYSQSLINVLSRNSTITLGSGSHTFSLQWFNISHTPVFLSNWFGYQPIVVLILPIAFPYFIWSLRASWPTLIVGCSLPLINLLMWGLYYDQSARFWATLALFAIVPVAYLLEDVVVWFKRQGYALAGRLISLAIVLPSFVLTLRLDYVLSQTDTRTIASEWIEENLQPETALISNFQLLELTPTPESLRQRAIDFPGSLGTFDQWLLNLPAESYPAPAFNIIDSDNYWPENKNAQQSLLNDRHINYAVIQSELNQVDVQPESIGLYSQQYGEPELIVCPSHNFIFAYLPLESVDWAWQSIWRFERPGPAVIIYRLSDTLVKQPLQLACH